MFTGIVQGVASVVMASQGESITKVSIQLPDTKKLQIGASVSIDGVCLTVTSINDSIVDFDIIEETLHRTTLGELEAGSQVNFERALRFGDELGGHLLSGHVMSAGLIHSIKENGEGKDISIIAPPELQKYIIEKGFVAIDGISLTIGAVQSNVFELHLIPETLRMTTLGAKSEGDAVNIEIDSNTQTIVSTVERILAEK
ncbi:MAG: riboflavin synthase subunit alpha [Euryarchaeota archaeon]|nr:riboflavin synthase subunit alpha [Euryarchaeota archaeon]MDG1546512.1 riboflavin synthase subunit alpha [Candidatus Poseidoniaceae archaeon]